MSDSNPTSPSSSVATSGYHVDTVAEHYDKKSSGRTDLASRTESPIYYLRNFNNWIKSVIINEYVKLIRQKQRDSGEYARGQRWPLSVLDLGCGKGGDTLKWKKMNMTHVTFADLSEVSLDICKSRCSQGVQFSCNFIHLDATRDVILDKYAPDHIVQHDLVSSQFVLHYSFESFEQADRFLRNVSDSLKPGGYFIGTTTNGNELVKRLRASPSGSFGNQIYNIRFDEKYKHDESFDLFGVKFDFKLHDVVECPEFLVNFDCLVELAKRRGLRLVMKKTFDEYFHDHCESHEYKGLIGVMQALEPYYPRHLAEQSSQKSAEEYEYIEKKLGEEGSYLRNDRLRDNEAWATLSKSEWEVATLYLVYAFVKEEDTYSAKEEINGKESQEPKDETHQRDLENNANEESNCEENNERSINENKRKRDSESSSQEDYESSRKK